MALARTTRPVVIVGLGHPGGGDDAIGFHVARALAILGFDARCSSDPFLVVPLLADGRIVIVVDAVLATGVPGEILDLLPSDLAARPTCASTHGFGLREALTLAQALRKDHASPATFVVGIVLAKVPQHGDALSPAMHHAASRAIDHVATLARRLASTSSTPSDVR
jgi:hydrogenase maturation protease